MGIRSRALFSVVFEWFSQMLGVSGAYNAQLYTIAKCRVITSPIQSLLHHLPPLESQSQMLYLSSGKHMVATFSSKAISSRIRCAVYLVPRAPGKTSAKEGKKLISNHGWCEHLSNSLCDRILLQLTGGRHRYSRKYQRKPRTCRRRKHRVRSEGHALIIR